MTTTVNRKAVFHEPTGKYVMTDWSDSLNGFAVDGIEEATLFQEDITLDAALDGINLQFAQNEPENFELRDVEVTYRIKEGI
jgi:hypothetical protein